MTLTRQTEAEIRALVKNGEAKEYGVTLTEAGVFCSCPDALYRGSICKHPTTLALAVLRGEMQEAKSTRTIHLVSQEGIALCGMQGQRRYGRKAARTVRKSDSNQFFLRLTRQSHRRGGRRCINPNCDPIRSSGFIT